MSTESTNKTREGRDDATNVCDESLDVPAAMIVVVLVVAGAIVEMADEDVAFSKEVI